MNIAILNISDIYAVTAERQIQRHDQCFLPKKSSKESMTAARAALTLSLGSGGCSQRSKRFLADARRFLAARKSR
jgi:hypothetical protein